MELGVGCDQMLGHNRLDHILDDVVMDPALGIGHRIVLRGDNDRVNSYNLAIISVDH